jgi:NADH-quinone oxidoreductase subunit C
VADETPKGDERPREGAAPDAAPKPAPAPAAPAAAAPAAPAAAAAKKGPVATDASGKPLVAGLAAAVPGAVLSAKEFVGETTVDVALDRILDACRHLKKESFTYLVDLTAVDWKDRQPRFDVVYYLHSFQRGNERVRLKVKVGEGEDCPSATAVFETANWMEREVFDLFGITFANHPDLRRILTWEGFNGHPLRKDFPVEGIDTGAAIYPDRYPDGGGPAADDPNRKTLS